MMSTGRSFYDILEVPQSASTDDIKRAFIRKQREYQNDSETVIYLNLAYETLCDGAKRKQYDIEIKFKDDIRRLKESANNCDDASERREILDKARGIYKEILSLDAENIEALENLAEIEEKLGDWDSSIGYLKEIEKHISDETEKVNLWRLIGKRLGQIDRMDECMDYYLKIYQSGNPNEDDTRILARLYYDYKKNLKKGLLILNDCLSKTQDNKIKAIYLCECLRALGMASDDSYGKIERAMHEKLQALYSDDVETNMAIFVTASQYWNDSICRKDRNFYLKMEAVVLKYTPAGDDAADFVQELRNIGPDFISGKLHEAILMFSDSELRTKEQFIRYVILDAANIEAGLEYIERKAPIFWERSEQFAALKTYIAPYLDISTEYQSLIHDSFIEQDMKKLIEIILLHGYIDFEAVKKDYEIAGDRFFNLSRERIESALTHLERLYPICYKAFSNIFFDGRSVDEIFSGRGRGTRSPESGAAHISGTKAAQVVQKQKKAARGRSGWGLKKVCVVFAAFLLYTLLPVLILSNLSMAFTLSREMIKAREAADYLKDYEQNEDALKKAVTDSGPYDSLDISHFETIQAQPAMLDDNIKAVVSCHSARLKNWEDRGIPVLMIDYGEEVTDSVICEVLAETSYEDSFELADIDGDGYDEILTQCCGGLSGGAGNFISAVYKFEDKKLKKIFEYDGQSNDSSFNTGFTLTLSDGYTYTVENIHTGFTASFKRQVSEQYVYFDTSGNVTKIGRENNAAKWLGADSFYSFLPVDIDGDGVFEISTAQYTHLFGRGDGIGDAYTILKWNGDTGKMDVIKAGYWNYVDESFNPQRDAYEKSWYFD